MNDKYQMDVIKKINKAKVIWQILPELSIDDLEKAITESRKNYYNPESDELLITDDIYDVLIERLKELDPNSSVLKQIGAPVKGKKTKLPHWMGSMDKIKTEEKLIDKWIKKYKGPYVISDKLDGISCLLTIINGTVSLYTRGDGTYGQNVTHLLDFVNMSIDRLLKIANKKELNDIAIRGELIMSKNNFKKYAIEKANARNMVAGIVNTKPESLNKKHAADVDFVAYELITPQLKPLDQLTMLKKWGLNCVVYDVYNSISLIIMDDILQKRKKKSIYEIDGIIITDNNKYERNLSGNPPYSFAYKGLTQTANVKVLEVIWKPSKDGILIPRIRFEKVNLSQADLEYTTGFNARYIKINKIGPGAIITVVRSGDVIPYILNVVKPAKPSFPTEYDYVWDKNKVHIKLVNADEDNTVIIQRLTKFVRNIGVDNLSEGIITKLVNAGYDTIPKIIQITIDDMLEIDGFGETLATKIYNNLQSALDRLDILTLMVASNIFGRGFGERQIKKILNVYPDIVHEYSKKNHNKWRANLLELRGFDTITVDNFLAALPQFQEFYKVISDIIDVQPYENIASDTGIFQGQTIVFTGFRNKFWKAFVEVEGGKVSGSVSGNTSLLVYNDGEESSAKYIKAKKLGVSTMSKSEFANKYGLDN